jgi:hypothetical protein
MKLFRFTAKDGLIAMTLAAIWCGALSQHMDVWDSFGNNPFAMALYYGLISGLPATTVAALFGHWRLGILCGAASALAPAALEFASFA